MNIVADIRPTLATAQRPALWLSFGPDSMLLLDYARQAGFNGAIYHFGDDLSKLAQQVIIDDNLTVYGCAPIDSYLIPNGDGLALVDEYPLGDTRVPMVSPIVKGDSCRHGALTRRTRHFPYPHDITLWGYRHDDWCEAVGETFTREINLGVTWLVAPLYELTDSDVYAACDAIGIAYDDDTNDVAMCDECLNAIINSDWDRQASLNGFRERFRFNH